MNEHDRRAHPSSFDAPRCPLGLVWPSQEHMSLSIMHRNIQRAPNLHYSFAMSVENIVSTAEKGWGSAGRSQERKSWETRVKDTGKELVKRITFQKLTEYFRG